VWWDGIGRRIITADSITCFGYGSLVNAATLAPDSRSAPACVAGWRRAWRHSGETAYGRRCTLTVVPDPDCAILGAALLVPAAGVNWRDGRPDGWPDPFLYVGEEAYARAGDADHPILLSYLDVVIAGFRRMFGEEGVAHFAATTADWHVPVLDDRAAPRYPRAVLVSDAERAAVDRLVADNSVSVIAIA
jgi:glutathione-specific gamma-glutamylcyclotransferase